MTEVHTYSAGEEGLLVNAYLVETIGVVAVDGTLTASDSRALRSRIDSLGKPLLGVLVHPRAPDHVAIANLLGDSGASVVALESVRDLMRATEEAKRAQWSPVYGDEWIPRWKSIPIGW